MNGFLIYAAKSGICIGGFFMVYWLFLRKDTLYTRNRTFILISVAFSLLLPLISIETARPVRIPFLVKILSEIFITGSVDVNSDTFFDIRLITGFKWLSGIYVAGLLFFGIKLIVDLLELTFLIARNNKGSSHIIKFYGLNTSGFSAFGHIFISTRLTPEETEEIIRHEQNHLNHHHSADIVFMEAIRVFQWFNPFIHLFSRQLRAVHEYQADEECINLGTAVNTYQKLLLNQVFRARLFKITNSFSNPSLVKSRIIMLTKNRSKALANLKLLAILPVIGFVLLSFSTYNGKARSEDAETTFPESPPPPPPPPITSKNAGSAVLIEPETESTETEPFVVVQEMPMFPGGENELLNWIFEHTQYPEAAKKNNIQGKVVVRFCVTSKGLVDRVDILKSVDPDLDNEAIRVVKTLPPFIPGRQGGKPVPVWYMIPINFTLR